MIVFMSGEKYPSPAFTKPEVTCRTLLRYVGSTDFWAHVCPAQAATTSVASPRQPLFTRVQFCIGLTAWVKRWMSAPKYRKLAARTTGHYIARKTRELTKGTSDEDLHADRRFCRNRAFLR